MNHAAVASFLEGMCSAREFAVDVEREKTDRIQDPKHLKASEITAEDSPVTIVTYEAARRILRAMLAGDLAPEMALDLGNRIISGDDFDYADEMVTLAIAFVADESRVHAADGLRTTLAELA